MEIIKDEDLIGHIDEYDVILVGTSVMNALGNGFQKKVALNFPYVSQVNKETAYGDPRKLGTVKAIDGKPIFCLCYINKGRHRPDLNPEYLDYDALRKCLSLVNKAFGDKKVASTLIGHSIYEGNGNEEQILSIIEEVCPNITIYDYFQEDYDKVLKREWNELNKTSGDERNDLKKKFFWKRAFGELTPLPKDYQTISVKEIKEFINKKRFRE